jgi:UDP-3-O-[3-hydroxymyristoyl] glucosamine N-acyltransferase
MVKGLLENGNCMSAMKLSEIADFLGGEIVGSADPAISGAAGILDAKPGDLTFVTTKGFQEELDRTRATAVIIGPGVDCSLPAIRLENPYEGFARFLARFQTPLDRVFPAGVHETAVIDETADVSLATSIGPYCVIGPGVVIDKGSRLGSHVTVGPDVSIGSDTMIYAQVAIRESCRIGNRVILHTGVRIGTDGFGFLPGKNGLIKIPQVGIVILEDDVEIGSNSCIDRATTGCTVIGQGTKLDNLIQIGHNVSIGSHTVISGLTGVAGSTKIGSGVAMGGSAAVKDHVEIGDGAQIAGKSGVIKSVPAGATVFGTPAMDIKESFRLVSALKKLPELIRRVRKLEKSQSDSGK